MQRTKLLSLLFLFLFVVSISATFYDSVIIENLHTRGAIISTDKDNSVVIFYYKNTEHIVEVNSLRYETVLADVAQALQMQTGSLPEDLNEDLFDALSATSL